MIGLSGSSLVGQGHVKRTHGTTRPPRRPSACRTARVPTWRRTITLVKEARLCRLEEAGCSWQGSWSAPAYSRCSSHRSRSRTAARARRRPLAYRPAISRGRGNVVSGFPELRPVNNPGPDPAPVMESSQTLLRAAGLSIDHLETGNTCTSESSTSSAPGSLCGSGSLPSKPELSSARRRAIRGKTSRDVRERTPLAVIARELDADEDRRGLGSGDLLTDEGDGLLEAHAGRREAERP